jgi:hypothetical protein
VTQDSKTEKDLTFAVGDRVRVKQSTAPSWIDKKLRDRVERGRLATVTVIVGTELPPHKRDYRLVFDQVGRERPFSEFIHVRDLEREPGLDLDQEPVQEENFNQIDGGFRR